MPARPLQNGTESEVGQLMASTLSPETLAYLQATSNGQQVPPDQMREQMIVALRDLQSAMEYNNKLSGNMLKSHKDYEARKAEVNEEQNRVIEQLSTLQDQIFAALDKGQEPQEYLIPRLFIALPLDNSQWDASNPLSGQFRLYFLCECGEHTKAADSKIPHHIHFARHEGYDIDRPKEFFRQYAPYVLTILKMLKFGLSVPGVDVPPVSQLVRTDTTDQFTASLQPVADSIEKGIDLMIEYTEQLTKEMGGCEALDGVDLSPLEKFNRNQNGTLGNLFRIFTADGHIKWVCNNHCHKNRQVTAEAFRTTVQGLNGKFDENIGRVEVKLLSRKKAKVFYRALENAKSVYELKIALCWDTTYRDYKLLRNTLYKTNVSALKFVCYGISSWNRSMLERGQTYNPIFDIMRHPTLQYMTIANQPYHLLKRSTSTSHDHSYANLRYLDLSELNMRMDTEIDIPRLARLIEQAQNLNILLLHTRWEQLPALYQAIEAHSYPIVFKNLSLRILPPPPGQSKIAIPDLTQLFKIHGGRIETCRLDDTPNDAAVQAFAEATQNGSKLKELVLHRPGQRLGDGYVRGLAKVVAQSELRKLHIEMGDEEECERVLKGLHLKHLQQLWVTLGDNAQWTKVMSALVDGRARSGEGTELEHLVLESNGTAFAAQEQLLSFASLPSLKHLELFWTMTVEQVKALIGSIDHTELKNLSLSAEHFSVAEVQAILEAIPHPTELKVVCLRWAPATEEQIELMKTKGISLQVQ